uniref:semaphorin-3D-like isoform X2 n=1 Tax=Myxine glutinosa TaxID=7769 RepID=UPI00358DEDCA
MAFLMLLWLFTWMALGTAQGVRPAVPRLRLSYRELLKAGGAVPLVAVADATAIQCLVVDEEGGWLVAGARDSIYLLNPNNVNRKPVKLPWRPSPKQFEHCVLAGKDAETECANFVRVVEPVNTTHMYVCGTGAYDPTCAFLDTRITARAATGPPRLVHFESGKGRCPYGPRQPLATVIAGGDLYAATTSDFMAADPGLFRSKPGTHSRPSLRSEPHEASWLNEPQFVAAFEVPESLDPAEDKVYIFFSERAWGAAGGEEHALYARVARVCKNDNGGQHSLVNKWTTFLKARLTCSVPGPDGVHTHFDLLRDVYILQTKDKHNPVFYGLFSMTSSVFQGSAVCAYTMKDIRAAFKGPFAHRTGPAGRWAEFSGRVPYPRPGMCPSHSLDPSFPSTRSLPPDVLAFTRAHQAVWAVVAPLGGRPMYVRPNGPGAPVQLAVHRVDAKDGTYDVVFLGTDTGVVLKVVTLMGSGEQLFLEELQVFKEPSAVLSMEISHKWSQLYVGGQAGLVQLTLQRCTSYGQTCTDCCLARDPYCAWDGASCIHVFPSSQRRSWKQDVQNGDPKTQCWDLNETGGPDEEEMLMLGVESNATFLECSPHSPQSTVVWLVQHNTRPPQELKTDERILPLGPGLLIRQLHQNDAGRYLCATRERGLLRMIRTIRLRVLPASGLRQTITMQQASRSLLLKDFLRQPADLKAMCHRLWQRLPHGTHPSHKWKLAREARKQRNRRHGTHQSARRSPRHVQLPDRPRILARP